MGTTLTVVGVMVLGFAAPATGSSEHDFHHVRSSEARIRALVRTGYDESPTFRALVDEIEGAALVVYLEPAMTLKDGREGELLLSVTGSRELPILRVHLKPNAGGMYWVGVVAHELQHVVEALRARALDSSSAMQALFSALDQGHVAGSSAFETDAAREVARRVVAELQAFKRNVV
jgi:hypothetical protein